MTESSVRNVLRTRSTPCSPDNQCDLCSGDCDVDSDCMGDLVCIYGPIGGDIVVNGCTGLGAPGLEYCGFPPDQYTLEEYSDEVPLVSGFDDISSEDQPEELKELPSAATARLPNNNPSVSPSVVNQSSIATVDMNAETSCTVQNKCSACMGHCMDDSECSSGLVCYTRVAFEDPPGCHGVSVKGMFA